MKYIGIFDSGIGGLTVAQKLMKRLPHEAIAYLGDTARCPYGEKEKETIIQYSLENVSFLNQHLLKILIVACGTASACAIDILRQRCYFPVVGVIEPTIASAVAATKNQRIAILATTRTIASEAYQIGLQQQLPQAILYPLACPQFAPLLEQRCVEYKIVKDIVKETLSPLKGTNIDVVILGCTHYPLLADIIQEELGPNVSLIDLSQTCAQAAEAELLANDLLSPSTTNPQHHYYATNDPDKFQHLSQHFFGTRVHVRNA